MRRPTQRPAAPGWVHPYTGLAGLAVFYNDGGDPPADPPKPGPPPTPAPSPQFTQDDLDRIAAKEKAQGQRAGARQALEDLATELGFTNPDDVKTFVAAARKAQQDALTEEERRRQELEQREQELATREAAATARERAANRRAVLVGLGATGDDLEDAAALLRVADDADDQTVQDAAAALKERRPELFGTKPAPAPSALPPAPGGAPAGAPPARTTPGKDDAKTRARELAIKMGYAKRPDAA
ncbi:DUF4355 domain-containing protein [Streptomyces sp. NBRC 110035]|uniref:DUF4355 domain-containing protein n=1 Tax=Streptomyces sp. NBRC 110035 TaxID=1547867 RepID=UPI0005AAF3BF|nr:DUF4355 domain-containing protein [Streptomyces sp. NBRC 110035]